MANWIYMSPHLDDVALSCGGLVWEQARQGHRVAVWTIFAGDPPPGELTDFARELHARWHTGEQAASHRREEDRVSCRRMGATVRHFDLPDAIYRRSDRGSGPLYPTREAIFGPAHAEEEGLVERLSCLLGQAIAALESSPEDLILVGPLTSGGHVDHRLLRAALEGLNYPLWYYADFPYVLDYPETFEPGTVDGWASSTFEVTPAGLRTWMQAVEAHASQIPTFWPDLMAMRRAIQDYCRWQGGIKLLRRG